jgi:hypothetical protein
MLTAGCGKPAVPSSDLSIELETAPQPPRAGKVTLSVTLTGAGKEPVSGARIDLEGDMSHSGMAPVFGQAKEVKPGRYQSQMELTMGGDWMILVHISLANGTKLERQVALNGVQP